MYKRSVPYSKNLLNDNHTCDTKLTFIIQPTAGAHQKHLTQWIFPGQSGRHFAYDIFNHIFLNESIRISIQISLKFVPTFGSKLTVSQRWFV